MRYGWKQRLTEIWMEACKLGQTELSKPWIEAYEPDYKMG